MSNRTIQVDDGLYQYILDVSLRELPLQKELREETASDPMANTRRPFDDPSHAEC